MPPTHDPGAGAGSSAPVEAFALAAGQPGDHRETQAATTTPCVCASWPAVALLAEVLEACATARGRHRSLDLRRRLDLSAGFSSPGGARDPVAVTR